MSDIVRALERWIAGKDAEIERLQAQMTIFENMNRTDRDEIERLRALLDAARICFKSRDQSEREAAVYAAICKALEGK